MPKEQINFAPYRYGQDGTTPVSAEVSINWIGGDQAYAQIGVELSIDDVEQHVKQVRKDSPGDARVTFYTEPLTRPELQRLIRAARRARDAVFDADE